MRFLTHSHDSILKILTINWKTQARMTPGAKVDLPPGSQNRADP